MRKWRIEDSEELYNIKGWGVNYFGINEKGHAYVAPKKDGVRIDLKEVVDDLASRDITAPVLLRFPDILDNRIEKTAECFVKAEKEYNYQADHFIIYPVKVNQMPTDFADYALDADTMAKWDTVMKLRQDVNGVLEKHVPNVKHVRTP